MSFIYPFIIHGQIPLHNCIIDFSQDPVLFTDNHYDRFIVITQITPVNNILFFPSLKQAGLTIIVIKRNLPTDKKFPLTHP